MSAEDQNDSPQTAAEKLARLVAQRKANLGNRPSKGVPGQRQSERAAGALAASKSRPAPRKG